MPESRSRRIDVLAGALLGIYAVGSFALSAARLGAWARGRPDLPEGYLTTYYFGLAFGIGFYSLLCLGVALGKRWGFGLLLLQAVVVLTGTAVATADRKAPTTLTSVVTVAAQIGLFAYGLKRLGTLLRERRA